MILIEFVPFTSGEPRGQDPKSATTSRRLTAVVMTVCVLGLSNGTFAQQKAPLVPNAAEEEAPVELSAFVVQTDKDQGYKTKNATSGTRANIAVKDLPISISVINKDFLDDLNVTYGNDALRYSPSSSGGIYTPSSANSPGSQSRGDAGFRGFSASNNFRDGLRTPSQSSAVNTERVEIVNGPSSITYGITPPGGIYNSITKAPVFGKRFFTLMAGFDGVEGSNNSGYRTSADYNWGNKPQTLAFRFATGYSRVAGMQSFLSDVGRDRTYAPSLAWRPVPNTQITLKYENHHRRDLSGGRLLFRAGSNGESIPVQEFIVPTLPRTWNYLGPESLQSRRNNIATIVVDQKITEWWTTQGIFTRYGGFTVNSDNRQFLDRDPVTGRDAARLNRQYNPGWQTQKDLLLSSLWKYELPHTPIGKIGNLLVLSYQRTGDYSTNINTAILGANGRTRYDAFAPLAIGTDIPALFAGRPYSVESVSYGDNESAVYSLNWQQRYAKERLLISLAASRVRIDQQPSNYHTTATKPLFGVVYRLTPAVNIFAIHSQTLFPTSQRDFNGNSFKPSSGLGKEIGVKIDGFGGRVSGTVSVFDDSNSDTVLNDPNFRDPLTGQQGRLFQVGQTTSKGGEIDLILSPSDHWQTMVGYGQHTTRITSDIDPQNVNTIVAQSGPKHKYTVWSKYTWKRGRWEGFSLAGGVIHNSQALRGYVTRVPRYSEAYWDGDLRLGYKRKIGFGNFDFAVQASNIFQQQVFDSPGWRADVTGGLALRPVTFRTPRTYSFTIRTTY